MGRARTTGPTTLIARSFLGASRNLAVPISLLRATRGRDIAARKSPNRSVFPFYLLTAWLCASSAIGQEVHFSPEERLDAIDVELIDTAKHSIDFASYSLTDIAVLDALNAADHRGVAIRIVLDPREHHDFVRLGDLADNVRIKRSGPLMHLKAYAIDGELLRTVRAANEARADDAPLPEYPCLTNYRRCTDNHDVAVMHQVKNVYRGIAHNADVIPIYLACQKEAELHGYPWIQGAFYDPYRPPGRSFIDTGIFRVVERSYNPALVCTVDLNTGLAKVGVYHD
jgi:hypothetical protein